MQFKHPELLWALFLLVIPVLIHLFNLRKFKVTPFTNVKLLQKVILESRKSNRLKKWLLLITRMVVLAAMVLAFAQPFFAKKEAFAKKELVIYLDDSFSMQAKTATGTLLSDAVQELLGNLPDDLAFSLFTNQKTFNKILKKEIKNQLLELDHTHQQLSLNEVYLKATNLFEENNGSLKNLLVVSDFQQRMLAKEADSLPGFNLTYINLAPTAIDNIAIDSVYITNNTLQNIELTVLLSSNHQVSATPVSLFHGDKLIAKTAAEFNTEYKAVAEFSVPANEVLNAKIEITDAGLPYDNQLFFNINKKEKIKVLAIGDGDHDFLKRIFTEAEFDFNHYPLNSLDYGEIDGQNLIVLNGLEHIPSTLGSSLVAFKANKGSLLVIPHNEIDFTSYNTFLSQGYGTQFSGINEIPLKITEIAFLHPLYRNVFEKSTTNFDYPQAEKSYRVKTNAPSVLAFQDKQPFLIGANDLFLFTAALDQENSNFKNSPLIVPTLYNMGTYSLQQPNLYYQLGGKATVEIAASLPKDAILKVNNVAYSFIPQQTSFANKVTLSFGEHPKEAGIYTITKDGELIDFLGFNNPLHESQLIYGNVKNRQEAAQFTSIPSYFEQLQNDGTVNEYWKWFVILALLFMVIEVIVQKYLK